MLEKFIKGNLNLAELLDWNDNSIMKINFSASM